MAPFLAYTCTVFQNNIAFTCSSFAVIIAVSNVKINFWKHLPTMKQWHYQFLATAKLNVKHDMSAYRLAPLSALCPSHEKT